MAGALSATGYACLMVALHVVEPSHVEITVQDHVRVDRVTGAAVRLIGPGTTAVRLDEGTYVFRTTRDAQVRLAEDATVRVAAVSDVKDPTPDPPGFTGVVPSVRGDSVADHVPTLTVR